jgi:hypothetical protein
MPERKQGNDVLSAVTAVHKALEPLSPEERGRAISSVAALLDISSFETIQAPETLKTPPPNPHKPDVSSRPTSNRPLSLLELMQEKKPKTNDEKIALFAYYREKHEGKPRFARADLAGCGKRLVSMNISRLLFLLSSDFEFRVV